MNTDNKCNYATLSYHYNHDENYTRHKTISNLSSIKVTDSSTVKVQAGIISGSETLVPGETYDYVITFNNIGDKKILNLNILDDIDKNVRYLQHSITVKWLSTKEKMDVEEFDDEEKAYGEIYAIVPNAAKVAGTISENRQIKIHFNRAIESKECIMISLVLKMFGEEISEDGQLRELSYQPNIDAFNAEYISNQFAIGFTIEKESSAGYYQILPPSIEQPELIIIDTNNIGRPLTANPFLALTAKDLVEKILIPVKFAKIYVSQEVYYKGMQGPAIDNNTEVPNNSELCYLIVAKNYGNISSSDVMLKNYLDANTKFIHDINTVDPYTLVEVQDLTYKIYDNSSLSSDLFTTGINNEQGMITTSCFVSESPENEAKQISYAEQTGVNKPYGIWVKGFFVELVSITIPARNTAIDLQVETENVPGHSYTDTINDHCVGVVEMRCFRMKSEII